MRRGPEAQVRLRAFSCHRCSCWLRHRCSCWLRCWVSAGCATGVPGAVGPARPLTVRAASFARRVVSKPGQALRARLRPPHQWGRVCCRVAAWSCLWPRWCSGRRVVCWRAGLLDAPVGGGPPAHRPRCELRSVRRLEARPGPAAPPAPSTQAARGACCQAMPTSPQSLCP